MRESSLVPTNLLNWPRVAPLLPELKLILLALWSSPYISCAGCGLVPVRPLASTLGLSPEALASGLELLQKTGMIVLDENSGEVFILGWYRFHSFKNGKGYSMLLSAVQKIESQPLRDLVLSKIPGPPVFTAGAISTLTSNKAPAQEKIDEKTGVIIRTDEDRAQLDSIIKKHGLEAVSTHAQKIREDGNRVFVSNIISFLESSLKKTRGGLNSEFNSDLTNTNGIFKLGSGGR